MTGCVPIYRDESVRARVLHAISKGATYELAAQAGGICFKTFRNWVIKAEAGEPEYVPFLQELKEAEAKAAVKWLDKIDAAMEDQWQAAAWKLERRYPKSYSANAVILEMAEDVKKLKEEFANGSKKVDSSNAHEKRSVTQRTWCDNGKKNSCEEN